MVSLTIKVMQVSKLPSISYNANFALSFIENSFYTQSLKTNF